jgi:hypothetical protein
MSLKYSLDDDRSEEIKRYFRFRAHGPMRPFAGESLIRLKMSNNLSVILMLFMSKRISP